MEYILEADLHIESKKTFSVIEQCHALKKFQI